MTALHLASRNGHVEVATALLEKGAAIDLTNLVSLSCVLALHVVMQSGVSGLATLRDIKARVVYKNAKMTKVTVVSIHTQTLESYHPLHL